MDQRPDPNPEPSPEATPGRLRLALAARAVEKSGLRARRAERLARLRAGEAEAAAEAEGEEAALPAGDVEALEAFLAGLVGTVEVEPDLPQPARIGPAVVAFERRAPARDAAARPAGDIAADAPGAEGLARLPGAGPGLVGTLIRAGVPDLATLAGLGREALADRLGPIGRLIDLDGWIAFARTETAGSSAG